MATALAERRLPLGGIVINRAMPEVLRQPVVAKAATRLTEQAQASTLAADIGASIKADPAVVRGKGVPNASA